MKQMQGRFPLVKKERLTEAAFDFTIHCPELAAVAEAGQFVQVLCGVKILRRPISICGIDREAGTLRIVFEVRGEGTAWLSTLAEGDSVDLMGPLGRGFRLVPGKTIVVGGGIGVPPLLQTARESERAEAVLGFRSAAQVILSADFVTVCPTVVMTEDGSMGRKGLVTGVLRERLLAEPCAMVSACGPIPMLKAVAAVAAECGVPCQVSLEERMGCGVGACLVCACKFRNPETGEEDYRRVCKDGPVFDAKEVCF